MTDVFISYASEDRERAKELAEALEARGWSVWWDRRIPAGKSYSEVIEQHLAAARCVVVLWSQDSVASEWVQNEAAEGAARDILVPALIADDTRIPLEFRRLQCANLVDWRAGTTSPELEHLMESIVALVPPAERGPAAATRVAPSAERSSFPRFGYIAIAALVVAIFVIVAVMNRGRVKPATDTMATVDTTPTSVQTDTVTTTTTETTATVATMDTPPDPDLLVGPPPAVGMLIRAGRLQCTAFLIADNVAVTTPSCVREASSLTLRLKYTATRTRDHAVSLLRDDKKNVTVLRVGAPATDGTPIQRRMRVARVGEDVVVPYYSEPPQSPTICRVVEVHGEELLYRCPMQSVAIGAPILSKDNELLGIHRGSVRGNPALRRGVPTSTFISTIRPWWVPR